MPKPQFKWPNWFRGQKGPQPDANLELGVFSGAYAPETVLQQQLAPGSNRFNLDFRHEFTRRFEIDPQAQAAVYTAFGLFEMGPIGAATANRMQWRTVNPAAYMPIKAVVASGIPHDAGMWDFQPLIVENPSLSGETGALSGSGYPGYANVPVNMQGYAG
jgi:hypothetical protein